MKLTDKTRKILNDEYYIEKQNKWLKRLENLFNGRPDQFLDEHVFVLNGIGGNSSLDLYQYPEGWIICSLEGLSNRMEETEKEQITPSKSPSSRLS